MGKKKEGDKCPHHTNSPHVWWHAADTVMGCGSSARQHGPACPRERDHWGRPEALSPEECPCVHTPRHCVVGRGRPAWRMSCAGPRGLRVPVGAVTFYSRNHGPCSEKSLWVMATDSVSTSSPRLAVSYGDPAAVNGPCLLKLSSSLVPSPERSGRSPHSQCVYWRLPGDLRPEGGSIQSSWWQG